MSIVLCQQEEAKAFEQKDNSGAVFVNDRKALRRAAWLTVEKTDYRRPPS